MKTLFAAIAATLISLAVASCAGGAQGASPQGNAVAATAQAKAADYVFPKDAGLKALASARGMVLGAAVMPDLLKEEAYSAALDANVGYLTPENHLKWSNVRPAQDRYDFSGMDTIAAYAEARGMLLRGHTLVWHNQNPVWLSAIKNDPEAMKAALKEHIATVVGRYKGRIRDWDVVNEVIDDSGKLRESVWSILGDGYIEEAFRLARAADPDARLFINDYSIETTNPKSDALYALVKDLMAKGAPIDGVGFQFHIDGRNTPDYAGIAKNFKRFKDLGLELQVTELDVRIYEGATERALAQQARIYAELFTIFLAFDVKVVVTWGIADKYTWIPGTFKGTDHPLYLGKDYRPKPAFDAIKEVLSGPKPGIEAMDPYLKSTYTRSFPPFRAALLKAAPSIDGSPAKGEWEGCYAIPLPYNQLDSIDQTSDPSDRLGSLRVGYVGDTIYGILERSDDAPFDKAANPYENDNFEFFYRWDGRYKQYRTVLGQGWQKDMKVPGDCVWSADGRYLEFSFSVGIPLEGLTLGFSAALSDNDGSGREVQVYPVTGANNGYQGRGYGEMTFQGADGSYVDGPAIGDLPLMAAEIVKEAPIVDGSATEKAWEEGVLYPIAFNQMGRDMAGPGPDDISGSFRLVAAEGKLYGLAHRVDDARAAGDAAMVAVQAEGVMNQFVVALDGKIEAIAGSGFEAAWSADGSVLEFSVPIGGATKPDSVINVGIGLRDDDGDGADAFVWPFPGYAFENARGSGLGAQMTAQGVSMGAFRVK
jgi:endo-1,4-beta-xylanase